MTCPGFPHHPSSAGRQAGRHTAWFPIYNLHQIECSKWHLILSLAWLHACMYVRCVLGPLDNQQSNTAMLLMGAPPSRCNVIFKETSLPLPLLALLTHLYSFYCMHVRFWPSFVHLIPMAYAYLLNALLVVIPSKFLHSFIL